MARIQDARVLINRKKLNEEKIGDGLYFRGMGKLPRVVLT
jgi:hypothetical protein